jgi:hypothetical protein
MTLSLRTRLTLWYTALLLLALALFTATVLWLHWKLMLRQADESLDALARAAANVVSAELDEHVSLSGAAREMASVVRNRDYVVTVLDADGSPIRDLSAAFPVSGPLLPAGDRAARTVTGSKRTRVAHSLRRGSSARIHSTIAIAMPLSEVQRQWRTLAKACAIGVPFVMFVAVAGG